MIEISYNLYIRTGEGCRECINGFERYLDPSCPVRGARWMHAPPDSRLDPTVCAHQEKDVKVLWDERFE